MKEEKKNIDLLFEEKLKQFRELPPAYTWDKLEKDLNRANSVRRIFYFRMAAASTLLLLAFGAGYYFATYNYNSTNEFSQEVAAPATEQDLTSDENPVNKNLEPESTTKLASTSQHNLDNNLALKVQGNQINEKDKSEAINLEQSPSIVPDNLIQEIIITESFVSTELTFDESLEINVIEATPAITIKQEETDKDQIVVTDDFPKIDPKAKVYGMESTAKTEMKWSVGAQFAPVLSYRDISINYANQTGNNPHDVESQLNDSEDALLSYAGGVDVNYVLSDRWNIQSGMYYSKIGQVNNNALNFKQNDDEYLLFAIRTSTGNINVSFEKIPDDIKTITPNKDTLEAVDLNNVKLIQNFDLFEIPFMVKYKILSRKLGINISGGLSPAYLVSNSTILQVDDNKYDVGSSSNLNSMIVNTSISLGINYQLSKRISLNLEPNFKYSLSPINKDSNFDYHPYYFSWFTGLSYKF
jgi:hypothetical protein